jgi:adenine-specific DNA-methyltransferase
MPRGVRGSKKTKQQGTGRPSKSKARRRVTNRVLSLTTGVASAVPATKKPGGKASNMKPIQQYEHTDKTRINNPPVGLVTQETDQDKPAKQYAYDPHLDPQLVWTGKAERMSFNVPTVSLHVHERIDPRTIIEAVRKTNGDGTILPPAQGFLFEQPKENPPLREAIDFYKHAHNWTNRLVAGDSLLVMNSLLEKEGMAGQVQVVYIDPPYGIKYGSNFQPFVNRREVKDGKDEDLTQEPEMIRAFRDTWELGIHSYLTYLRDRLLLSRELMVEAGSIFVQINNDNLHFIRQLMDEIFGAANLCGMIVFQKTGWKQSDLLSTVNDNLLWYARDIKKAKFRQIWFSKLESKTFQGQDIWMEHADGRRERVPKGMDWSALPKGAKLFRHTSLKSAGESDTGTFTFKFDGRSFNPGSGQHWKTTKDGLARLASANRLIAFENTLEFISYLDDFPYSPFTNIWTDTVSSGFSEARIYVVQTGTKVVERCLLMTSDPSDLVFDPTCGSGTTAYVSEKCGRRWITCDTSRVSVTLAKQRLMTSVFDYYELAHPEEGISSGFNYLVVPHFTMKTIATDEPPFQEVLYDQPVVNKNKVRVTGPFTVEAVPAPTVKALSEVVDDNHAADASVSRSGATVRHAEWRDELLKTGIRGSKGQKIEFSRVEPLAGTRWIHADAETKEGTPQRVVIAFGPEDAPLEQRQVEMAWEEARTLRPKPSMIVFAAFQFDPEAAKDIDELTPERTGMTFLKAQMNGDLLTEDLKKKRASNESFWLIGQPDVGLRQIKKGDNKGKYEVEVNGFDYYNTKTGTIESGDDSKIAVWLLDTDYDGRSLYPRQVFFPLADADSGWTRLAKNLKAEIDPDLIESYRGTVSLPFEAGKHKRVAVKIVDDRGIESLKIVEVR